MTRRQVTVVGAGPAGLAAAHTALSAGADVTLIDAEEQPGGQYHRTLPDACEASRPETSRPDRPAFERRRRQVLDHPRCTWWPQTVVWALERPAAGEPGAPRVHVLRGPADGTDRERRVLAPDALVLATGAHDRVLPFPGWELPGVYTGGAAQALVKGERIVVGERVVVAGTGPFLLPVTASLLEAGSRVLEVLEANGPAALARGWSRRPWQLAGKAGEFAAYAGTLARHRVPYRIGRAVIEARGEGRVEEIVSARLRPDWSVVPGSRRTTPVDAVCVTHGFSPQLELALAAGCALRQVYGGEFVDVDDRQRTSRPAVFAAGEITGVAGEPAARAEGALAGWFAAGGRTGTAALAGLRRRRDRGRAFAERLASAHPVGTAWHGWLRPETVICRCEETDYASLCRSAAEDAGHGARAAKLETRAGLGPCQGRICGPTVAELTSRLRGAPKAGRFHDLPGEIPVEGQPPASCHRRPITQPVRLGELAAPAEPDA
ncbi:FAD-dependent oxidoreductase [Streptomyces sp. NPDC049597]|uniref:FAD-dependent oxidoreductase n=1 Tax=Streptomyces sp. NPDC049597 TaxID=3155276 RepID=UPI003431D8B2